ncbi:rubrerythrin family protein [Synergistaceae bacterium OttesenSCG-928-D05]|nr:rubrerythrin family protein [Synergistaceae bacterium OttesenSCG-928-D05]
MKKTNDNYATAFAGESQANRKYLFFAEQAEKEGFANAARLFRATAEAETIHARHEFKGKGGIGTTAENLVTAKSGETYEFTEMYPPMIEDAKAEGNNEAVRVFNYANEAEKVHARLFEEALANLGNEPEGQDYYLCPICGFIHKGSEPSANCPICGAKPSIFTKY